MHDKVDLSQALNKYGIHCTTFSGHFCFEDTFGKRFIKDALETRINALQCTKGTFTHSRYRTDSLL